MENGNPKLAIRYAKRIIKDNQGRTPTEIAPGTKVYELVEEMTKYLPEKMQDIFRWMEQHILAVIKKRNKLQKQTGKLEKICFTEMRLK